MKELVIPNENILSLLSHHYQPAIDHSHFNY